MSAKVKYDSFPDQATREYGRWGDNFGTLYTMSRADALRVIPGDEPIVHPLSVCEPEIYKLVMDDKSFKIPGLTDNVTGVVYSWTDTFWGSTLVSCVLLDPDTVNMPLYMDEDAHVADLIAAHLLLGWELNGENLKRVKLREKYLPFTLSRPRYHVFHPTRERLVNAGAAYLTATKKVRPLLRKIRMHVPEVRAYLQLREQEQWSDLLHRQAEELGEKIAGEITPFKSALGFLYQDLPGSKNTRPYSPAMHMY